MLATTDAASHWPAMPTAICTRPKATVSARVTLSFFAAGTSPGGVLLLSEKIRFEDPAEETLQTDWHHAFKRARGYSDLEIARKREALENVLRPETLATHRRRLEQAGFTRVYRWFQGFNFVSLVALR